jgi:uncharacterized protein (TIGR00299 family) protein
MRIAYLDCFSGISGDMFLAALVDAGVPASLFEQTVAALNAAAALDARLEIRRVERSGISSTKVDVWVGAERDEPRQEHNHQHHHSHEHSRTGASAQHHSHEHEHSRTGASAPQHSHAHRGLKEIRGIIGRAGISETAKSRAREIFEALGAAEAKIHNIPVEQVHFHEVGAADAIVDIICAAVGSEALGVDDWICSPLNVGSGSVECAHGRFPVPAPATAELLKDAPVFSSGIQAELVTPTGAAIVKTLAARFAALPEMKIEKIGYGAGSRDFHGHANVVRILVGDTVTTRSSAADNSREFSAEREPVTVLEASLDDLNPQVLAYALERALAAGALDAFAAPLHMKKNRSGMLLTVLTKPADAGRLAETIFRETSTLGVRVREENRFVLPRKFVEVETAWGAVRIKTATLAGEVTHYAPEFEDCRRLAEQHQIPLKQVIHDATRAYLEKAQPRLAASARERA